ncbi:MAG: hypothetical protein J1E85_08585 [Ruminococcus sp.]|nr:hypothetical protein [Ruminococcus sp.]
MLSNSKQNTNNIIFYSVLVSYFENFDFKDDALAGVRANYFNSDCSTQKEITEVEINSNVYNLSYNMNSSSPLSWKVMRNNRPYQSVKIETGGFYCVLYYSESEYIYKRVYFDNKHSWLKTEYYENSDKPICRISPDFKGKELRLKLERNLFSDNKTSEYLYSSTLAPTKNSAALAYTNSGMMWFDTSFNSESENQETEETFKKGFNFNEKSFDIKETAEFDITKSDYLDESKLLKLDESKLQSSDNNQDELTENSDKADNPLVHGYSAYDMIQNILIEAQKTNKNLFGDVIEVQNALETDEIEKNDDEYNLEIGSELKNDTEIVTTSGKYLYYGDLDEIGNRHGKGRTVTPDGLTAYEGEYKNNLKDGFGVGYYKTGSINYVGNWIQNNRSGAGVGYRLSDGTMHAGRWIENKPDGYGARFDTDGNLLDICNYNNGIRNGKSVSFDENGNIVISVWQNGEKILEKVIQDGDLIE